MAKPLNPLHLQRLVEDQMTDTCYITEDVEGTTDDLLDPITGGYTPPAVDTALIYQGKCFLNTLNVLPSQTTEGGATTIGADLELHLPKDSPQVPVDTLVVITASMRDANLIGDELIVRSSQANSLAVDQTVRVYAKEQRIVQ